MTELVWTCITVSGSLLSCSASLLSCSANTVNIFIQFFHTCTTNLITHSVSPHSLWVVVRVPPTINTLDVVKSIICPSPGRRKRPYYTTYQTQSSTNTQSLTNTQSSKFNIQPPYFIWYTNGMAFLQYLYMISSWAIDSFIYIHHLHVFIYLKYSQLM